MNVEERKNAFLRELKELMTKYNASFEVDESNKVSWGAGQAIYLVLMPMEGCLGSGSFELGNCI